MSSLDDFAGRLRGLVISLGSDLQREDQVLVMRMIDHDEGGEALLTLAWILVEQDVRVQAHVVDEIRTLSAELIEPSELPADLDEQIKDELPGV